MVSDMSEPAVVEWRAALGQSTSAQLRETQATLAASQADLTAMQQQRDEALAAQQRIGDRMTEDVTRIAEMRRDRDRIIADRDQARAEAREWRATAEQYLSQRDNALHDLAHAKFALSMAKTRVDHWKERAETALGRLNEKGTP